MSADQPKTVTEPRIRVSSLRNTAETAFALEPDAEARRALATELGIEGLRKLRFTGTIRPSGASGWQLAAKLGATVVQSCIVTLEPVTTRIDAPVERRYVPAHHMDLPDEGSETEMPEDDTVEPLGEVIDLGALMHEELALSLPAYPRKDGVSLEEAQFAEDGVQPMTDDDVKPFAGLASLREKMNKGGEQD